MTLGDLPIAVDGNIKTAVLYAVAYLYEHREDADHHHLMMNLRYLLFGVKDNYHLGKLERTLAKADLLILDELSYLSFNRHQSELLFKVISDRSEKSSTIVTTNLPFSKWTELFENTTMVAALIDRLTFRSHVLDMNGDSYRLKATIQSKV